MAMLWEKVVVTAREFLETKNINDSYLFNDPVFRAKLVHYDWDLSFSAASIACELIWKASIGKESITDGQRLDRLFSPSPVATHCNFRGCRSFKTGNVPELGAIVFYRRGNSWQGDMSIIVGVAEDKQSFTVIGGRVLEGSNSQFINLEQREKRMGLPFKSDKLNLLGFVYAPEKEIN